MSCIQRRYRPLLRVQSIFTGVSFILLASTTSLPPSDDEQNCIDTQLLLLWAEAHLLDDSVNSDAFANDLFGSPIQLD